MPQPEPVSVQDHPAVVPRGITAVGVFLFFGAAMAALAGITLTWSGTVLDRIWSINPIAYRRLSPLGAGVGILFLILSAILLASGIGWFLRRRWAWGLATTVIAIQVGGNLMNLLTHHWVEGAFGFTIASALMWYLLRPVVRGVFQIT